MASKMIVGYRIGDDGYLAEPVNVQVINGVTHLPPHTTLTVPGDTEKNYQRWDAKTEKWIEEPKPTKPEDFEGLRIDHYDRHARQKDLRERVQKYGDKEGRRVIRGENLEWMSVAIPESEAIEQEISQEQSAMDSQLNSLRERMSTAMLMNDQDQIAALQAEFKAFTTGYSAKAKSAKLMTASADDASTGSYGYCPLCGSPLDADGICTNQKCQRRALQLRLKAAQDKAKADRESAEAKAKAWKVA